MAFLTEYSFLGGFVRSAYYHTLKLTHDRNYRLVSLLRMFHGFKPRYRELNLKVFGVNYLVPDIDSFLFMLDEIYVRDIYLFKPGHERPVIIDVGANIGVSVNYFKKKYPCALIEAYEADEKIFKYLQHNIPDSDNVSLHNVAVWKCGGELLFSGDGADGGKVGSVGVKVKAIDIKEILAKHSYIDLLKIDIEGAESEVIPECAGRLGHVEHVFVEYHSTKDMPQGIAAIMAILTSEGFRLSVQTIKSSLRPFIDDVENGEFDLQLNIFGWRN